METTTIIISTCISAFIKATPARILLDMATASGSRRPLSSPCCNAKIILLHGVGANGRQMIWVLGHPLVQAGYETMSLDLPSYGLTTYPSKSDIRYEDWIKLVSDCIDSDPRQYCGQPIPLNS